MPQFKHPLIFVRHGQTPWNEQQRYQGTVDTELSPTGVGQAKSNANHILRILNDREIHPSQINLVTSPLKRARETANIFTQTIDGLPSATIGAAFQELSIGRWEGLTSIEVKEHFYEERKSRKLDRWNFAPAGGESLANRADGIKAAVAELPSYSIVITHCVVIRAILHVLGRIAPEDAARAEISHIGHLVWDGEKIRRSGA